MIMPLGDPEGGLFEYTDEGLPEAIFAVTIPARDPQASARFYVELLGMEILGSDTDHIYLRRGSCNMILERSDAVGVHTGILFRVDCTYNTRRRLIDEDVRFETDPKRGPLGTYTTFYDLDGNTIGVIEGFAEFRL